MRVEGGREGDTEVYTEVRERWEKEKDTERQREGGKDGYQERSDHQLNMSTPLMTHSPAVAAACLLRAWGGGKGGWSQWTLCEGWTAAWCHVQPRRTTGRHSSSELS